MPDLAKLVKENTRKRYDPFGSESGKVLPLSRSGGSIRKPFRLGVKAKGKGKALASTSESEGTPSSTKRRRLLEDEEEVDDQLGVDDQPPTPASASGYNEMARPPPRSLETDTARPKQSRRATGGLASGLLAYRSDEEEEEAGQSHKI